MRKLKMVKTQFAFFDTKLSQHGKGYASGHEDTNRMCLYNLRGFGPTVTGPSIRTLTKFESSIYKSRRILIRFKRRIKKEGWLFDKVAIRKKASELREEKRIAITASRASLSIYKDALSIPS